MFAIKKMIMFIKNLKIEYAASLNFFDTFVTVSTKLFKTGLPFRLVGFLLLELVLSY